jgi:hypothetical protein
MDGLGATGLKVIQKIVSMLAGMVAVTLFLLFSLVATPVIIVLFLIKRAWVAIR